MPAVPQGNVAAKEDPARLLTMVFKEINGVYTQASRVAIPDDKVYNLENIIPIGPQNAVTVENISSVLFDFASDEIYYQDSANLNNQEYIINFATNGGIHLFNVQSNTDQVINISNPLSGSGSRVVQWKNTVLLFIDQSGYYSYDGTTFQQITGAGVPTSGDDIAVYSGRVWIAQGRLLVCSGANDYTAASFTPANGSAFVSLTDPQIRSKVQRLTVSNAVLYAVSETGVNAIYNVVVPTGAVPPTPTFNNDNIQAIVGSDQPASIFAYGSNFMMANRYGVYQVYGVSAPKVSDDINGTWQYVDFNFPISGGQVVVKGLLCAAFLLKRFNDPVFGSNTIIALFTQRSAPSSIQTGEIVWWFANFGNITSIVTGIVDQKAALFCLRDNKLYQLFEDASTAPSTQVMTKLWPMEDDLAAKEVMTVGFKAKIRIVGSQVTLTADSQSQSYDTGASVALNAGSWVNLAGVQGPWVNAAMVTGGWFAPAATMTYGNSPPVSDQNVGMTLSTVGYSYELNLMAMDYKLRQRWS